MDSEDCMSGPSHLRLHFSKDDEFVRPHEVPALVLTQALAGIQRIVHLVAMYQEQREIRTRARVTQDIEQKFPIMCQIPSTGSYELPVVIGTPTPDLVDPGIIEIVSRKSNDVLAVLSKGDSSRFRELVTDASYRKNILKAAKDAAPNPRIGYKFSVRDASGDILFDAHDAIPNINQLLRPPAGYVETYSVITGKFVLVDFEARKIEIMYPPNSTILDCLYQDDLESILLNNPRELIQVVGSVEMSAEGMPIRITDVQGILEIDLSPINLTKITSENFTLLANRPVIFTPSLSESSQFYLIDDEDIGISVISFTRDDLIEAIQEEIEILWIEIANEDDGNLTEGAIRLKYKLKEYFREG